MHRPASAQTIYQGLAVAVYAISLVGVAAVGNEQSASADPSKTAQRGFVVSDLAYALGPDAKDTGGCPDGMSENTTRVFENSAEGKRRAAESDEDYLRRLGQGSAKLSTAPSGQNLCVYPEAGTADPHFRTVKGSKIEVDGIDLDGQDSRAGGKAAPGTCAHDDFQGTHGTRSVDNQFYRVVGCTNGFQSTGLANSFAIEMLTGSWGILITLKGVQDLHDAKDVEVDFYANADPIQLSAARQVLPYATYAVDPDHRFRATTHGRIVNGVLTTDPVDMHFHQIVNSIRLERGLEDARLRATFTADGAMQGILAGYTSIDNLYDFQFGFRNGKNGKGEPANASVTSHSANGAADKLGYSCNGIYYALKQLADGHRDPKTGQCTAISTQYKLKAIPAFVVDTTTVSANSDLVTK